MLSACPPLLSLSQFGSFAFGAQIARNMRNRWVEMALADFGNSVYKDVDYRSYNVWAKYNWWMVPWWDQVEDHSRLVAPAGLDSGDTTGTRR